MISSTLHQEIHPSKNPGLNTDSLAPKSSKKIWWLGKCRHEWEAKVANRTLGSGCPFCSGHKVLPGYNDFQTHYPELASQWHPLKNLPLTPDNVASKANRKVWWQCDAGHEWEAQVNSRVSQHTKCPICSGSQITPGVNDLSSLQPALASQWHPTKNNSLTPQQFSEKSSKKVWWVCDEGHEWEAKIYSRSNGNNCPYCSNRKVLAGYNDLATVKPMLAAEWHEKKNSPKLPNESTSGHNRKVWWQCSKGHEWRATPNDRAFRGSSCPSCSAVNFSSKAEHRIEDFLSSLNIKIARSVRGVIPKNLELDIYLPECNLAIEYNGIYWYDESRKSQTYHYDKWAACNQKGIQLIQIWEDDWNRNPELVKNMLAHKLKVTGQEKVFARKTNINLISKTEAETFLGLNHIQGFASGSYYLALKTNLSKEIKAVLVLKKEANSTLNIIRYATSAQIQGGFTKLLKYAQKEYTPDKFVTFSDNCVSDGGLYEKNGFTATKNLPPDYMYVVKGERKHKFGYRLKKFKNDPNLLWEEGLTERELALLNNIPRIWDAGKTKWEKVC